MWSCELWQNISILISLPAVLGICISHWVTLCCYSLTAVLHFVYLPSTVLSCWIQFMIIAMLQWTFTNNILSDSSQTALFFNAGMFNSSGYFTSLPTNCFRLLRNRLFPRFGCLMKAKFQTSCWCSPDLTWRQSSISPHQLWPPCHPFVEFHLVTSSLLVNQT